MDYTTTHNGDGTVTISIVVPAERHKAVLAAAEAMLTNPASNFQWFVEITELYEKFYRGRTGKRVLAEDVGVTRQTIINWLRYPRKSHGRVIEPTYENRVAITALLDQKHGKVS